MLSHALRSLPRFHRLSLVRFTSDVSKENQPFVFRQLFDDESSTYTYLLGDRSSGECVLVDPVLEQVERDCDAVRNFGLKLKFAINTHVHADHITGTGLLKKRTNCRSVISRASGAKADVHVNPGELIKFGQFALSVRPTPGHTNGCVTYVCESERFALTGDALLIGGCGRTDFQEGDSATLYESVHREIFSLPPDFKLFPAHDYKGLTFTTVQIEKTTNPRLSKPLSDFIQIMNNLNLPYPKKIGYSSLLKDDGFSRLNTFKVRRLIALGLAEMLGTAFFVGLGCSSIDKSLGFTHTHFEVVVTFAFAICSGIFLFGPISGALMNPALNLALVVNGHMSIIKCLFYTVFQILGAYLGVMFVRVLSPDVADGFCVTQPNPLVGVWGAFAVEFVTTMFLILGLCHVTDPSVKSEAYLIFIKFLVLIVAIAVPAAKYGGCSMNPARSIGPAIASGLWDNHWIYWVAPLSGSLVAAIIYKAFLHSSIFAEPETRSSPPKQEEAHPI